MFVDPGNRTPAPAPLRMVQRFVNTVDIEHGREELATPSALCDLLLEIGALDAAEELGEHDLRHALEVREALRELLLANNGGTCGHESLATLERAGKAAHLSLRFDAGARSRLGPAADGLDAALGRLLAVVHDAMAAGTWARLKACRREVCYWVFYDQSKNRSSKWCAMSVCGNRTKKARAQRRRPRSQRVG
jgi:predicted RNA-binding Zn ribbon-like protein